MKRLPASLRPGLGLLLTLVFVTAAVAGGFGLSVDRPPAGDARFGDAVLAVRAYGCHDPQNARVSATAEGLVDGERRSQPVALRLVDEGVYALDAAWPAGGAWVFKVTATYRGHTRSALVAPDPSGSLAGKLTVRNAETFSSRDVDAALDALAEDLAANRSAGRTR